MTAQLLTYQEAAQFLRISRSLLYKLVRDGSLPKVKLGGQGRSGASRFRQADLEALVESKIERRTGSSGN